MFVLSPLPPPPPPPRLFVEPPPGGGVSEQQQLEDEGDREEAAAAAAAWFGRFDAAATNLQQQQQQQQPHRPRRQPQQPTRELRIEEWREREQRARSVRLLLMFLLMLVLMEDDNSSNVEGGEGGVRGGMRRGKRLRGGGAKGVRNDDDGGGNFSHINKLQLLSEEDYAARLNQDGVLRRAGRCHPRYQHLVQRNGGRDAFWNMIWIPTMAHVEQESIIIARATANASASASAITAAPRPPGEDDPYNREKRRQRQEVVFHYAWNTTGFYRGGWTRGPKRKPPSAPLSDSASSTTTKTAAPPSPPPPPTDPVRLESRIPELLQDSLAFRRRSLHNYSEIKVAILPPGVWLPVRDDHNLTTRGWERTLVDSSGRTHTPPSSVPQHAATETNRSVSHASSWLLPPPKSNSTLLRDNGRIAFQLYSRGVPGMVELSLVDGFVKLYDSAKDGFSTNRDMLVRVRGVYLHSIGRLSLVSSNVDVRRTALLVPRLPSGVFSSEERTAREAERSAAGGVSSTRKVASSQWSSHVVPYPFVRDDAAESLRRERTPAYRKMPPREQALEANAASCEFEIDLDAMPVEFAVGTWSDLLAGRIREQRRLDPSSPVAAGAGATAVGASEPSEVAPHYLRSVSGSSSSSRRRRSRSRKKVPRADQQALVVALVGTIHSSNCDFSASVNVTALRTDWDAATSKAVNYSFYMMLVCLVQILVLLRQLLHTQSNSAAVRVSLMCVGHQTVLDALLCLAHIYLSLAVQQLFTAFATVAFFKLLIFCVIEMKYMAMIVQARNSSSGGQPSEVLRRQVAHLHLRIYVALLAVFLLGFYVGEEYRTWYVLGLYSFWVPQILYNVYTEAKAPLHKKYLYGMSASRLVAPLYILAVPNNFLKEVYPDAPTDPRLCELLLVWVGLQTAVLVAQSRYGARFMIPARFLPPKFDYSRPLPPSLLPPGVVLLDAVQPQPPSSQVMDDRRMDDDDDEDDDHDRNRRRRGKRDDTRRGDRSTSASLSATDEDTASTVVVTAARHRHNATASTTRNRGRGGGNRSLRALAPLRRSDAGTTAASAVEPSATATSKTTSPAATASTTTATLDCSICFDPVDVRDRSQYMLAPCDHLFHRTCLLRWMDHKHECPTCRADLPSA